MDKPFFCAIELRREISLSPHSGFLSKEQTKINNQKCGINRVDDKNKATPMGLEQKRVLPLPQTVIKVDVTLRANLSIYRIRLRK